MKFGKDLEQYKHPGWEDQYINYRELKNILRKLEEDGAIKDEVDGEFFQALEDELEKVNRAFYEHALEVETALDQTTSRPGDAIASELNEVTIGSSGGGASSEAPAGGTEAGSQR